MEVVWLRGIWNADGVLWEKNYYCYYRNEGKGLLDCCTAVKIYFGTNLKRLMEDEWEVFGVTEYIFIFIYDFLILFYYISVAMIFRT